MMIYPPIADLVEKTGSRYTLVIEAARRARQLSSGTQPLCEFDSNKEVSIATNEIYQGKLEVYNVSPEQKSVKEEAVVIMDGETVSVSDAIASTIEEL